MWDEPRAASAGTHVSTSVSTPAYAEFGGFTVNPRSWVAFAGTASGTFAPEILNPGVVVEMVVIWQGAVVLTPDTFPVTFPEIE
jgi:hypothetical protein